MAKTKGDYFCDQQYSFHHLITDKESKVMWLKNVNLRLNAVYMLISFCCQKTNTRNPSARFIVNCQYRLEEVVSAIITLQQTLLLWKY